MKKLINKGVPKIDWDHGDKECLYPSFYIQVKISVLRLNTTNSCVIIELLWLLGHRWHS